MNDAVRFCLAGVVTALLAIATPAAHAAEPAAPSLPPPAVQGGGVRDPAAQAAGLFMQSCVRFAAQPKELRHWAEGRQLAQLPGAYANSFLYGLPGRVYDATTPAGRLVLVSQDGGSCSVVADKANGTALLDRLDADLKATGVTYKITADGPDPQEKALHNRAYDASLRGRHWLMLISTVGGAAGGVAMLTTNP